MCFYLVRVNFFAARFTDATEGKFIKRYDM